MDESDIHRFKTRFLNRLNLFLSNNTNSSQKNKNKIQMHGRMGKISSTRSVETPSTKWIKLARSEITQKTSENNIQEITLEALKNTVIFLRFKYSAELTDRFLDKIEKSEESLDKFEFSDNIREYNTCHRIEIQSNVRNWNIQLEKNEENGKTNIGKISGKEELELPEDEYIVKISSPDKVKTKKIKLESDQFIEFNGEEQKTRNKIEVNNEKKKPKKKIETDRNKQESKKEKEEAETDTKDKNEEKRYNTSVELDKKLLVISITALASYLTATGLFILFG